MTLTPQFELSKLPPEILQEISSYLTKTEILTLKLSCLSLIQFEELSDQVFKPLILRLLNLDKKIPKMVEPTPTKTLRDLFNDYFHRINIEQLTEIWIFKKNAASFEFPESILNKLNHINNASPKLRTLEERRLLLDEINAHRIRQKINPNSSALNLSYCDITCIPDSLLQDPTLTVFWKNLTALHLWGNNIQFLPDSLIEKCPNLKTINVSLNLLQELPKEIEKLTSLQDLNLNHNMLKELPASLTNCRNLLNLHARFNQLSCLDPSFSKKFYQHYVDTTLENQNFVPKLWQEFQRNHEKYINNNNTKAAFLRLTAKNHQELLFEPAIHEEKSNLTKYKLST
ncbi:MAG: leucine-rich repeat domain-containing protein [Proteobacteria bacterium]|nr:leucine-rich repeat domain-containing protein [Pseudomonadota bacterium]